MKNKSVSIPMGMVTKKFYCHKCGEKLQKFAKTRTVKPGDPDYKEHSRFNHRTHMIGDVEVTEYDFKCPACHNMITYDEQQTMALIQKKLSKNTLSEDDIENNIYEIAKVQKKKENLKKIAFITISLLFIGFILYLKIRSGDFSLSFYF